MLAITKQPFCCATALNVLKDSIINRDHPGYETRVTFCDTFPYVPTYSDTNSCICKLCELRHFLPFALKFKVNLASGDS